MPTIAWLHLSDWHQSGSEFQRVKVRDTLLTDLRARAELDPRLQQLSFAVFSGDVAFSGRAAEYQAARSELLTPALSVSGVSADRLVVVPGNHDVDRGALDYLAGDLLAQFTDGNLLAAALADSRARRMLLEPFTEYRDFARSVSPFDTTEHPAFGFTRVFHESGLEIQIIGLNSALFSGQSHDANGEVADEGKLLVGAPQYYAHLTAASAADIRIAVLHHPLTWLAQWERVDLRRALIESCDFVLHGHEHVPNIELVASPAGEAVIIPAGAAFHHDLTQYSHSYNLTLLDTDARQGTTYFRRWSNPRGRWIADSDLVDDGVYCFPFRPREDSPESTRRASSVADDTAGHERALREYRRRLLAEYGFADHRGIAGVTGTPFAAALPADELYVVPRLLPADRPETRERERTLLKLLDDPDVSPPERARHEEEYAALTGQQWQPTRSSGAASSEYSLGQALKSSRQVVLLGGPGVGKSALTRFLIRTCLGSSEEMHARLGWAEDLTPILVPLAAFAEARVNDRHLSLRSFILAKIRERGGMQLHHAVEGRLVTSDCLVLLDGIDEVPESRARARVRASQGGRDLAQGVAANPREL